MTESEHLSTGDFSRRTRLSRKALRVYERSGLLCPATVDPDNGYRRYGPDQVRIGQLIGLLRAAELSLEQTRSVLDDLSIGVAAAVTRLDQLVAQADRRQATRMLVLRHVQATLIQGAQPMFEIHTRHVPVRRFMSIQRRVRAGDTDAFVREAKATFAAHLGGVSATGPFTLIFHGPVDDENDGPLEASLACPGEIAPSDAVGIRTEPAHGEAFTTITRAQWAFPAILAAYDAVACSPPLRAHPGSRLSCREVYLAEPEDVTDTDLLCDVAFPLGEPAPAALTGS